MRLRMTSISRLILQPRANIEDVMAALAMKVADAPQAPQWKSDSFFRRFLPQAAAGQ